MADPTLATPVSRRTILKGMAGAAGLVSIPAIIAACSSSTASSAPSAAASAAAAERRRPERGRQRRRERRHRHGHIGQQLLRPRLRRAMEAVDGAFTAETGIAVKVNTVDHNTFQDQITQLPRSARRTRPTRGSPASGCSSSPTRASTSRSTTSGPRSRTTSATASQARRRQRRQGVLRPVLLLPVGRHLPQERLRRQGLHRPEDVGRVQGPLPRRCRPTASPRSRSATRTAGPRWARSTS